MSEANTPARPVLPSEQKDVVSLREFEQRLFDFHKLIDERTRYEREILSTRENSLSKALEIADAETKRRLDELNHAHAQAMENWRTSLPRELFEQWKDEHARWKESVNTQLTLAGGHTTHLAQLQSRVAVIETLGNRITGALILLGVMGLAGVMAFFLGIARLLGLVK